MQIRVWLLAIGMVVGLATATRADESRRPAPSCGHVEELAAAKNALEKGNVEGALRHLRNADALLSRCQRDGRPAMKPGETEPAEPAAVGGAVAPPTTVA